MTTKKLRPELPSGKARTPAWWWSSFIERASREPAPVEPTLADVTRVRALALAHRLGWQLEATLADAADPDVGRHVAALYRAAVLELDDPQASLVRSMIENAQAFQKVYRGRTHAELEAAGATVEATARAILARVCSELCLDDMTEDQAAEIVPWIVGAIRPRLGGRGNRTRGPSREHARQQVRAKLAAVAPDLELIRTEHSLDAARRRRTVPR